MTKSDRNKEKLPTTAPKKTWGGQWYSPGSFLVATFVTGGQVRASKAPRFLAAKRCTACPNYFGKTGQVLMGIESVFLEAFE